MSVFKTQDIACNKLEVSDSVDKVEGLVFGLPPSHDGKELGSSSVKVVMVCPTCHTVPALLCCLPNAVLGVLDRL